MKYKQQNTIGYYNEISKFSDESGYNPDSKYYPANYYRLELAKRIIADLAPGKFLDAGCGTGQLLMHLMELGNDCTGCDFSSGMLKEAKRKLAKVNSKHEVPLICTALDKLSMFADQSFDHIFCLGVFPYIPEELEDKSYRELRRVIKKGGAFVSAHENEIFDTFTFNKYSLRFFERNIFPMIQEAVSGSDVEDMKSKLATLFIHSDKPINRDKKNSARDIIYLRPENPLIYDKKIANFGFHHEKTQYYHFHALPPLLRNEEKSLLDISSKMEIRNADSWQGLFMASTFISVARAV